MIELTVADGVAEVVLNAPDKLNALDPAATRRAVRRVRRGRAPGRGRRACARSCCAARAARSAPDATSRASTRATTTCSATSAASCSRCSSAWRRCPVPTFAVAHGACLGVGLGLLIASDIVYVADTAKIGSPFANLGATLDSGGHALFVERLGAHKTMDLIVTGRLMSGTEAVRLGPVLAGVPGRRGDGCRPRGGPRRGIRGHPGLRRVEGARRRRSATSASGSGQSMDEENRAQAALCDTDDYREGFAAFQQKRRPEFTGPRLSTGPAPAVALLGERARHACRPRASSNSTRRARSYSSIACSGVSPTAVIPTRPCSVIELIMWNTMPACRDWSKCSPCRATTSNRSPTESARSSSASRWSVATRCFSAPSGGEEAARSRRRTGRR